MRSHLGVATILASVLAVGQTRADDRVDYLRQVKPLLTARCYACHGALQKKGGLRADTAAALLRGGESGPAVIAGQVDESELLTRVTAPGSERMPPPSEGEGLKEADVALLKRWVEQGANAPSDEKPEVDPRDHWAFRSPVRPEIPRLSEAAKTTSNEGSVGNPIDAFLAVEWEKRGLKPQPRADKGLLLRRVYLDLIGVPPTDEEREAFTADTAPDAYEKVVDRLLASKQYGERWGRHWMDVWRYSDWWGLGADLRNSQKHIWHWRDWIIESLNADKGYDQMVREMLAADELYPNDLDKLRDGFLARHYFKFNRNTWLEETVEHTGKAFLGLTFNCAKCHDHKYDPISQQDYYRFRAFFEPYQVRTDEVPGEVDFEKDGLPRVFDCNLEAATYCFVRGNESQPIKDRPLKPGLPAPGIRRAEDRAGYPAARGFLAGLAAVCPGESSPRGGCANRRGQDRFGEGQIQVGRGREAKHDDARTGLGASGGPCPDRSGQGRACPGGEDPGGLERPARALRARAAADRARSELPPAANAKELATTAARQEREAAIAKAEEDLARAELALLTADAAHKEAERGKRDTATTALATAKKSLETPSEAYTPLRGSLKTLESNLEKEASLAKPYPSTSTGRRSALASWITDRRHPLTARVAINHIWVRHFGKPLVPTIFDLGRKGTPPTHAALLDWLAVELVEQQWSMKHLHRLIVTSEAYRRTSASTGADPATLAADPENHWYWRMNPVRMEAQVVRDSLLQLAGVLDPKMGGPPLPAAEEASPRRSLYFTHSHNEHQKFLNIFDDASVLKCYRRSESIVPVQALALSNSRFSLTMAAKISARLHDRLGKPSDAEFARSAFMAILDIAPSPEEQAACEQTLADLSALLKTSGAADPVVRARNNLVQALLNHNDFITIR